MNNLFITNIDMMIKIYELAQANGKKQGESIEKEFIEMMEKNPDQFQFIGKSKKDIDLLSGDMREAGLKVLNMKELDSDY